MKKVIVSGATGFIGGWLTQELLRNQYEVVAIARNPEKLLPEIRRDKNLIIVKKDLNELLSDDFTQNDYDVFFNLGWAGVSPEQKNDVALQVSNISMTLNALHVCHDVGCNLFISTGTVAEYALTTDVMDLYAKQSPNDMYGAAKVSTHYFLEVESRRINQPFIWTVIPSTFGERRTDNNIITYTIQSLLNGKKPQYGNLEQMWDFLYVSEVVRALRLIGEKGKTGKVYGIGSGQYRPLKDYVKAIRDIVNPELELGIGERPSLSKQSFSSCVNIYELIRDTGFQPQIGFEEGIRKTIQYWEQKKEKSVSST